MAKLLSKFRGSLTGAAIGDCIGAVFEMEGMEQIDLSRILSTVNSIERRRDPKRKSNLFEYTDDTAMARSVAASLIDKNGLDVKDMAKRFADEFHSEPNRDYGGSVVQVFKALVDPELKDIFEPARLQFDGQGSFGNGGAMRIVPAALYCYNKDIEYLKNMVDKISRITHTHIQAIQGAILQTLAVHLALHTTSGELKVNDYLDTLVDRMNILETESTQSNDGDETRDKESRSKVEEKNKPYCLKLKKMKDFLTQEPQKPKEDIIKELGNDISALGSVPAAVYSFLRSTKTLDDELKERNGFERTIIYAISLGGDTDTIATMAGAIAGAYYGLDIIPESWQLCCEGTHDAQNFATKLEVLGSK